MVMMVSLRQAHEELGRLLELAEAGEEVLIVAADGRVVARLAPPVSPVQTPPSTRATAPATARKPSAQDAGD